MSEFSFTLDEIKQELYILGYKNVPVDKIMEFKADLELLVRKDESIRQSLLGDSSLTSQDMNKDSLVGGYEDELSSVGTGESSRRMKRKTLRKHNGRVSVEETYTTDGSIISYPATTDYINSHRTNSVSSNRDRSTFSALIKSVSYESSNKLSNKSDPVSRYHEYQRFWRDVVIPGEKQHKRLRWQVRNRVGEYQPAVNKNKLLPVDFKKKVQYDKVLQQEWSYD